MEQEPQEQQPQEQEQGQAQAQPQKHEQEQPQPQPQDDPKPDAGAAQGDGGGDAAAGDSAAQKDSGLEMMLSEMPLASVPEEASIPATEDDFNDLFLSDEQADQPSSSEAHGGGNARGAQQLEQLAAQQAPAQAAEAQAAEPAEPTVRRSARARRPPHVRRESSCMVDSTSKLSFAHPS